ncbi:MAG: phosphopyruvate hydratase [Patescibacteria group bacterium]|nr:phosphopyruvate hydratase [Patescibacteria group bacterium]
MKIKSIDAFEILDSRGNPTVKAELITDQGIKAAAQVPSGASTGEHEALELRDGDDERYRGLGVMKAIGNIQGKIGPALIGMEVTDQSGIDKKMIELDASPNKSGLGANATLGVSMAAVRAAAETKKTPLYRYVGELFGRPAGEELSMPELMCNVINGGAHADSGLDLQEYMLVPAGGRLVKEKVRILAEIYQALKDRLKKDGQVTAVGDEGGFAPKLKNNEEPLGYLIQAIEAAGYKPGQEVGLALDAAASEFFNKETGKYELKLDQRELDAKAMTDYYQELVSRYPIVIIEDGMAQDDTRGWKLLNNALGGDHGRVNIMGDDFTVTNKKRLEQAVEEKALNSVLIKLNQIGTVTETLECLRYAKEKGIRTAVSHRSGETTDDFIADFCAGAGAQWLKAGSVARGERVAKYNRLIEIERELEMERGKA